MTACPAKLTFDYAQFKYYFPAFSNPVMYPEATLQMWWDSAINYVSDQGNFGAVNCEKREYAIYLFMLHLLTLNTMILAGQVPGLMQDATVDKVHVALTPPPLKNQWQWWLSLTPYGQQYFSLMQAHTAGGFYVPYFGAGIGGFRGGFGGFGGYGSGFC